MSQFLLYYQRPEPATWVYLSSFLIIGLYFVFHRFWSVRNLDILLLILLGPGLLLVHDGRKMEMGVDATMRGSTLISQVIPDAAPGAGVIDSAPPATPPAQAEVNGIDHGVNDGSDPSLDAARRKQLRGFVWLFFVEALILIRLLWDPMMVRRPLLDPNLTTGGLVFIGASMLIFLLANVITSTPQIQREQGPALGPGYPVLNMLPAIPTTPDAEAMARQRAASGRGFNGKPDAGRVDAGRVDAARVGAGRAGMDGVGDAAFGGGFTSVDDDSPAAAPPIAYAALARTLAIVAHLAILIGLMLIGSLHFGNFNAGAGCATLYLLLPYTAQMTGRVDHALPAAFLVWAILLYRRPLLAGVCLGLAAGLVYYPAFLLPLWLGFYRQRGLARFAGGVAGTIGMLTILLSLGGSEQLSQRLIQMYGLWLPWIDNLEGVWGLGWQPIWRLPVLVAFVLLAGLYSFWPRQKNLGTLMSCSATLMVAAQFWHGFGGGLFVAWFLPLMLLTVFRPNLEDRVALKVIGGNGSARKLQSDRLGADAA
jgi:hypothetical protein